MLMNGYFYETHNKAVTNFFCKANYEIKGPVEIYCDGKRWNDNSPSCIGMFF